MLVRPSVEVNVVEHCNLRCHACDHAAPLSPPRFASPERFAEDAARLGRVLHVGELRLLGGEPLLHPRLAELAGAARASGLADRIVLVSNGLLLDRLPEEVWRRIDKLWLSLYPGVRLPVTLDRAAELCRAHGVELHPDVKDQLSLTQLNQPIQSPELVETIFRECKSAHEWCCHTLHDGRYFKCPTAALAPERLRRLGVRFEPHARDAVALDGPELGERLGAYLADERPLAACAFCLGSSGPPVPARQLDRAGLQAWMREDHRGAVAEVAAALARDPGGRAPLRTTPLPLVEVAPASWRTEIASGAGKLARVARDNSWPRPLLRRLLRARPVHSGQRVEGATRAAPSRSTYSASLAWLRQHVSSHPLSPGELGDTIPTLLDCGERRMALHLADRLRDRQSPDGSWSAGEPGFLSMVFRLPAGGSSSGQATLMSTARAVAGLAALPRPTPPVARAIERGSGWLHDRLARGGRDPWRRLVGRQGEQQARLWAELALQRARDGSRQCAPSPGGSWYLAPRDPGRPDSLTHELWQAWAHEHAFVPGLLFELGRTGRLAAWADAQEALGADDGWWPAFPGASWVCPTCLALGAATLCRLGRLPPARRMLACLASLQHPSGGFPGSAGPGASFRRHELVVDGARAYLDAVHLFLQASFDAQVGDFADEVEAGDGRVEALLRRTGDLGGKRVLDAGCGRGAVARALRARFPALDLSAMDHSARMLARLPADVPRRQGSLHDQPFADGEFDVVYCIEALEHACNPEAAVAELGRVTRPGGLVVIVDKNAERAGVLDTESWERWFRRDEVEAWLRPHCGEVRGESIRHAPHLGPDLFIAWSGRRLATRTSE